ncbi:hypothetical protein Pelo_4022 [Pelomyxa schiedti]|nr:hypothetical protein Pelo_4022 [Pelomyxa schiedti]
MRAVFTVNWVWELMLEFTALHHDVGFALMNALDDAFARYGMNLQSDLEVCSLLLPALPSIVARDKERMAVLQYRYSALEISPRIATAFAVLQICLPEFLHPFQELRNNVKMPLRIVPIPPVSEIRQRENT